MSPPPAHLVQRLHRTIAEYSRPVLLPTIAVWVLATYLAGALLHSYDISEYAMYAHRALHLPVLHSLPSEYPAPALAVFIVPLVIPVAYPWAFAVPVGGVLVAVTMSMYRATKRADPETTTRLLVYLVLGSVMFVTARFDVFAVAAAYWSMRSASRDRWGSAWAWSAVGAAIKLFPAVLWPALMIAEHRRTGVFPWKRLMWVAGTVAAVVAVPAIFDPPAVLSVFHYYLRRPPEIGSLAAGLSLILDPGAWHHELTFHSFNAVSPLAGPIAAAVTLAAVCGCLFVWRRQSRGGLSLEAAALATMTLVVVGSKVGSVQYLLWLMPFWALYRLRVSWVLACFINSIVFPYTATTGLNHFLSGHAVVFLTLLYSLRDVLIVVGTVSWLRELRKPDSAVDPVLRRVREPA